MRSAGGPPTGLRVEHLTDPIGTDLRMPRLSWRLPAGARRQVAYQVRSDDWDSGRIESDQSLLVGYAGPASRSRQRVDWTVRVWTDAGLSPWAASSSWEVGLLAAGDWTAEWIEPPASNGVPGHRPAVVLRSPFVADSVTGPTRIYATAHGVYELFLNGVRVGDQELTPGFTSYRHRLQVQTYDVDGLVRPGENELVAVLSDGWWRGQVGFTREHDVFGASLALLAQVEIAGRPVAATGSSWEWAPSAITEADPIEGQHTNLPALAAEARWGPVAVVDHGVTNLVASPAPPVRRVEHIRPASVTRLTPDRQIVDLGQNINGWLRLEVPVPLGSRAVITHGESLDEQGDVDMDALAPFKFHTGERLSAGQVDVVVGDGTTAGFEPRHTTHGFQYARVEGITGTLTPDHVTGIVVHTDLERRGWFACSDSRLNQLHEATVWSFRTNACDIPTDCPQRERAGWTGDWQLFAPTGAFLYDVAGFSTKWLRDLAADQRADGVVRNFAPDPAPSGADDDVIKTFLEGAAGWGDAAVLVPWAMWRAYGDERLLEEQWPSMVAWVEYQARSAASNRHPDRVARNATPAAHERYLWDSGFHWGEWLEPDFSSEDHFNDLGRDFGILATAYFCRSAEILARIATVLGRPDAAEHFGTFASGAREAWQAEYLEGDGTVRSDRQADLVRALAFELVPAGLRGQTADRLVDLVRAAGTHLTTGFLATPFLLPVLADTGHLDVAYELLLQDTPPSWLSMIDRGATTIWEAWNGTDGGDGSLNHYSKGAVVSFLHEVVGGIRICDHAPAYRCFEIAPQPGGGLTWAEAVHESPYGRIESAWSFVADRLRVVVKVPPGTTAHVRLPGGGGGEAHPGTSIFEERANPMIH